MKDKEIIGLIRAKIVNIDIVTWKRPMSKVDKEAWDFIRGQLEDLIKQIEGGSHKRDN